MYDIEKIDDEKIIVDINGKNVECDVLFTYDGEDVDKPIIGYTDHTTNEQGIINIYVSKYDPLFNPNKLEPVTDKEDLELVDDVIKQIQNQYQ